MWVIAAVGAVIGVIAYLVGFKFGSDFGHRAAKQETIRTIHQLQQNFALNMGKYGEAKRRDTQLIYDAMEILIDGLTMCNGNMTPDDFNSLHKH